MKRLLSIALVLSFITPTLAVDDAAEAPADSSGKPGLTSQNRIALKLLGGTIGGIVSGTAVILIVVYTADWCSEDWCADDHYENRWSDRLGGAMLASFFPIGIAVGVTAFDRHDRQIYPLAASLLGLGAGYALDAASVGMGGPILGAKLWVPVIAATVASEWSRDQPKSRRYSIGLRPQPAADFPRSPRCDFDSR